MSPFNLRYVGKLQKPQRIEALTDGTLAIVMTILVLELALVVLIVTYFIDWFGYLIFVPMVYVIIAIAYGHHKPFF